MQPRLTFDIGWVSLAQALLGWPQLDAEERVRALAERDGAKAVVALSVRTLLDALLTALACSPGDRAVMSAVNIEHMAEIIRAHGLELDVVDIDPQTLTPSAGDISANLSDRTRLLLIAQLFGARSDLRAHVVATHTALLVEDCAQAFDGRLDLPEGVDVALYSFGPIKSATALGGAIGLFRDVELAACVQKILAGYPVLDDGWFRKRVLRTMMLKLLSHPLCYAFVVKAITASGRDPDAVIGSASRSFSGGALLDQIRRRPPARLLDLLVRRLQSGWSPARRVERAKSLLEAIGAPLFSPGARTVRHAHWLTPILSARPTQLIAALRAQGFDATRGATSMRALAGSNGRTPPHAAELMREVVYLPNPPSLHRNASRRLAALLRRHAAKQTQTIEVSPLDSIDLA